MCQIDVNGGAQQKKVCRYWRMGKCTRPSCPYLHTEHTEFHLPRPLKNRLGSPYYSTRPSTTSTSALSPIQNPHSASSSSSNIQKNPVMQKKQDKVYQYWAQGKCTHGDNCRFLHSWFTTTDASCPFSMLGQLPGHQKTITGLVFPSHTQYLVSTSQEKSLKLWNCHTGQCDQVHNFDGEIGSIIHQAGWIFIGLPNQVKAWNIKAQTQLSLTGPVGQVYAMEVSNNGMLLAGDQSGNILAWRMPTDTDTPKTLSSTPTACLKGHTRAVISLTVGTTLLYSGSMDNTIRVWDLETMQCVHTLTQHTSAVTSLLCWKEHLVSSSLDETIKVWCMTESGAIEPIYTHKEDSGVIALQGMVLQDKDILMCSCNDNAVRLYQLPSFKEVGKIFSEEEVRATGTGPHNLFFTGDAAGHLRVWKWSETEPAPSETPV